MRRPKKYASASDVARLANVSQSAVSRAFSGGGPVSAATRQKVLAAAEQLNYRPSALPRIMLTERSHLVAIVIGGMYNPFYARVLETFTRRFQETGHQVLLFHADSGHAFDSAIPLLAGYRVDAIVSALAVLSDDAAQQLATFNVPVVGFNTAASGDRLSSVCCDNVDAAARIADLFVERGARTFGFVAGPPDSPASIERLRGFADRLTARGHPPPDVRGGDFTYEAGRGATADLVAEGRLPDALFCANDLIAFGAIDVLRAAGIACPQDVLVAGFDDVPMASWGGYDLTSVVQDADVMVEEAIRIIAAVEDGERPRGITKTVPARILERGSTGGGRV